MTPYQERMIAELVELRDRIERLSAFIVSTPFKIIDHEERELLYRQRMAMNDYEAVLARRVRRFTE